MVVLKELIYNRFYFGRMWWSWKNWFLTVSTLTGCGGLETTKFNDFFLDLACKFCILHGFKESITPTTNEAEVDSLWNPEEETPAGNHNSDQRIVISYADCHWGWLPSEPWGGVTSRQLQCQTLLADQRSHQLNPATYTLYIHLLISPMGPLSSFQANANAPALDIWQWDSYPHR